MKKLIFLLLGVMILVVGCKSQSGAINKDSKSAGKSENSKMAFEYEAMTRGVYNKIIVTQDSIITIKDREKKNTVAKLTKKADWDFLITSIKKIHPEELGNLKAPSNKNFVDAALAANLKVISNGVAVSSPNFDHGNPPAEIKELVNRLIAISDLKKK